MQVINILAGVLFVGVFLLSFNQFYSRSSKKVYLELLLKLEENPDDKELKDRTIKAGRVYNQNQIIVSRFSATSSTSYGRLSSSEDEISKAVNNAIDKGRNKQMNKL